MCLPVLHCVGGKEKEEEEETNDDGMDIGKGEAEAGISVPWKGSHENVDLKPSVTFSVG